MQVGQARHVEYFILFRMSIYFLCITSPMRCTTSLRALCYYLDNHQIPFLPYHGDLNSKVRDLNLESFRSSNDTEHMVRVCC